MSLFVHHSPPCRLVLHHCTTPVLQIFRAVVPELSKFSTNVTKVRHQKAEAELSFTTSLFLPFPLSFLVRRDPGGPPHPPNRRWQKHSKSHRTRIASRNQDHRRFPNHKTIYRRTSVLFVHFLHKYDLYPSCTRAHPSHLLLSLFTRSPRIYIN